MSSKTASVNDKGILTDFIAQAASSQYQNNGDSFTEKFKGPYSEMINCSNGYVVAGAKFIVGQPRPNLGNRFKIDYNPPSIPIGYYWVVRKIQAEELDSGDHGLLTVEYEPIKYSSEIRNFRSKQETWSISWQSQSLNVLAYCTDDGYPESEKANSTNIVACARGKRPDTTEVSDDNYAYSWIDSTTGETKTLNKIEKAIFRKYINDKNPIFHYPVITHTQVIHCEKGASFSPKIATDLDAVSKGVDNNNGNNCPFDLGNFEWLHTGSNITCQFNADETKDYTITDTWWGAVSDKSTGKGWDGNFYKNGTIFDKDSEIHWNLGEM